MKTNKLEKVSGILIVVVLALLAVNSTYYFLGVTGASVVEWLAFNACAPSIALFIAGYIVYRYSDRCWLLIASITPLVFFGTMGLFIFPWDGYNIIGQISHIVMTLAVVWIVLVIRRRAEVKDFFIGLLTTVTLMLPLISLQQLYARVNSEALMRLLGIN